MINNSGLTTIEEARSEYNNIYDNCSNMGVKIELKCWMNHSESRNNNNNKPFTFNNYGRHMRSRDYIQQIELNMIDYEDIGTKDEVISFLENRSLIFD